MIFYQRFTLNIICGLFKRNIHNEIALKKKTFTCGSANIFVNILTLPIK